MHERIRGRAKRVLVVGAIDKNVAISPDAALAPGGMMILMGQDAPADRSDEQIVISGDPKRMLYKLAGPFDAIFCSAEYSSLRPALEGLLAIDGVLIADGRS